MARITKTFGPLTGACALAARLAACIGPAAGQPPSADAHDASADPGPASSGFFTPGQASRGERRFEQLCADCHRTIEITRSWFSGDLHRTAGDLWIVMSMTMPESSPGSLSPDEYADILAYLLKLNDYPAGDEDLLADPSVLENVPIPAP